MNSVKHIMLVGPSCCGKSTIGRILGEKLNTQVLTLDDYYIQGADPLYVMGPDKEPYRTFERPYMYNGAKLAVVVGGINLSSVVEGFLLLHYPEIRALNAVTFYLDITTEESVRRRALRPRTPDSDISWPLIGPSETKAFVEPQKAWADYIIDGTNSVDAIVAEILMRYN